MNNKSWVVSITTADGSRLRGIQKAMYQSKAIEFFAKNNGVKCVAGSCESLDNFNHFLAQGKRQPLA